MRRVERREAAAIVEEENSSRKHCFEHGCNTPRSEICKGDTKHVSNGTKDYISVLSAPKNEQIVNN
jgi:hypothetical protein